MNGKLTAGVGEVRPKETEKNIGKDVPTVLSTLPTPTRSAASNNHSDVDVVGEKQLIVAPVVVEDFPKQTSGTPEKPSEPVQDLERPKTELPAVAEPTKGGPAPGSATPPPLAKIEPTCSTSMIAKRKHQDGDFCWDFQAGHCSRGSQCQWAHVGVHANISGSLHIAKSFADFYGVQCNTEALHELATLPDEEMAELLSSFDGGDRDDVQGADVRSREIQRFCRRHHAETARQKYPDRWQSSARRSSKHQRIY